MCRLAAFPPGTSREEALEILLDFEGKNTDGVGSVYVKNGEFIVEKYPTSLSRILKKRIPFLNHMPHKGWTVAHLRAASHGKNTYNNTHPFIVGDWGIVHNGIWSEYNVAKLALSTFVKFKGDTDSEVAANVINLVGPEKFAEEIEWGGVYLALNRSGKLWAIPTSGQLSINQLKNDKVILASEFNSEEYPKTLEALRGWYEFGANGKYIKNKEIESQFMQNFANYEDYDNEDYESKIEKVDSFMNKRKQKRLSKVQQTNFPYCPRSVLGYQDEF